MKASTTEPRWRGLILNAHSIEATLVGDKTETRRIVKGYPAQPLQIRLRTEVRGDWPIGHTKVAEAGAHDASVNQHGAVCVHLPDGGRLGVKPGEFEWVKPYARPGDLLWIRETWSPDHRNVYPCFPVVYRTADSNAPAPEDYREHVPGCSEDGRNFECLKCARFRWRSPRFMPRRLSRITLRVTHVHVEQLQTIEEHEAMAEGAGRLRMPGETARDAFRRGWDKLNLTRGYGWASNPWVWVVRYEVHASSTLPLRHPLPRSRA